MRAPTGWAGSGWRWSPPSCSQSLLWSAARSAGLFRLKRLAKLRLQSDAALAANDRDEAAAVMRALIALYGDRPDTARPAGARPRI
jgi:hypothetical protein